MQGLNFILLLVAVGSTSACKYFCRPPGTFEYECCDDGNPYFNGEVDAASSETGIETPVQPDNCNYWCLKPNTSDFACCEDINPYFDENPIEVADTTYNGPTHPPSRCYYYCAYDGEVYCCGDDSRPIPENHDMHEGRCPEEEEQVCKSTGVFLNPKISKQKKASGAIRLVSGPGKEQLSCASDGYCSAEEKCCPSQCARKHICMKAIDEE